MLRFHTPLIEPDRQISRIRLSDKAYSIEIFPPRHGRRLVLVVVVIASGTSQPLMEFIGSRQSPGCLSRPQMGLERRPLPSTGVTRLQRYYEPLRHPGRPGLSLAGVRLRVTRPHRLGFPVLRWISMYRHAVVITPVARWVGSLVGRPIPTVSLLASSFGLPHASARSALTLDVSRPARRSLALRPACSLHRQSDTYVSKAPTASLPPPPLR